MLKQRVKEFIIFSHRTLEKYHKLYRYSVSITKFFIPAQYREQVKRIIVHKRPLDPKELLENNNGSQTQHLPKQELKSLTAEEKKFLLLLSKQYNKTFT